MKFDFCIGNPPYQEDTVGENDTYAPQVYHKFIDEAYKVADVVEMIHPGRFLFDAGSTPKAWNQKMLNDPHFKVLHYEADTKKIFNNVAITGGIAITYHDERNDYGAIEVFTPFNELNSILHKVVQHSGFESMEPIVYTRTAYRLTDEMHKDHPEAIKQLSDGHAYDMSSNIFDRLPQIFYDQIPNDGFEYIRMLGRKNNERTYMYLRRKYSKQVNNLDKYKLVLAQADGAAGTIGNPVPARVIGAPVIEGPGTGTTESFISIGEFEKKELAEAALKYVKTRFVRTLVSVLKVTQAIPPGKWKYVPLQDFSSESDIIWTDSIEEIDEQLFQKYGLVEAEIQFIKKYVKEMV